MSDRLDHLRAASIVLQDRVHTALRVQVGDVARLQTQIDEVFAYRAAAEQVSEELSRRLTLLSFFCVAFLSFSTV